MKLVERVITFNTRKGVIQIRQKKKQLSIARYKHPIGGVHRWGKETSAIWKRNVEKISNLLRPPRHHHRPDPYCPFLSAKAADSPPPLPPRFHLTEFEQTNNLSISKRARNPSAGITNQHETAQNRRRNRVPSSSESTVRPPIAVEAAQTLERESGYAERASQGGRWNPLLT